jgi:hypothetical protein
VYALASLRFAWALTIQFDNPLRQPCFGNYSLDSSTLGRPVLSKALRHDLLQPASAAVLILEQVQRRNTDARLQPSLDLLEQALRDLAAKIEALS